MLYAAKNLALTPRRAIRRRTHPETDPDMRRMLDQNYYRRALLDWRVACIRNPDILIDLPIDQTSVVFDVGAFRGDWSAQVLARYGATVHGFEPAPGPFQRMRSEAPDVVAHEYALGGSDGTVTLSLDGPGSNTLGRGGRAVDVQVRDVAAVVDELGPVDVLTVNIEGGEYDLFDRLAETGQLAGIGTVLVQFHEWAPWAHLRRRKNRRALARTHLEDWSYPWVWERWSRRG